MPPTLPLATYRLQLTHRFTFDNGAELVPYLAALGVSHVYASPFLQARAGSNHGYDVIDYAALSPELGGEAGFARFNAALARAGMGLILDFVPNHMAIHGADNRWWLDVLECGPRSPYAPFFDIDWKRLSYRAKDAVLLPLLGRPYGEALASGDIALDFDGDEGTFSAWYFEHRLPIAPHTYGEILRKVVSRRGASRGQIGKQLLDLARRLVSSREDACELKRALATIPGAAELIQQGLQAYRPQPCNNTAAAVLHRLLERQHYRLGHWRLAATDINYRRFFDIDGLAGVRVEHPPTFAAIHKLVLRLVGEDQLHGLRLDHIDGLLDPYAYFDGLQRAIRLARPTRPESVYTVIEKILAPDESLPSFPGVAGTTGYEWLNVIARVLIDSEGSASLAQTWRDFTGETCSFDDILIDAKRYVLGHLLASEFSVLAAALARIAAGHRSTRDFAADRLRATLEVFVLHFPVYRTYVTRTRASAADRAVIAHTIDAARRHWRGLDQGIFDFLQDVLTLEVIAPGHRTHSSRRTLQFVGKLQQFTGPTMAKSLEDTAFYRDHSVLALNEVGGRPDSPALSVDDFHARLRNRANFPHGLTATATHDTKRGEDARARLLALTELSHDWALQVENWRRINSGLIANVGGIRVPSGAHEYLFYQALLGAWPIQTVGAGFIERVQAFMRKAAREGKQQTSWLDPNADYERGLEDFIGAVLDPARSKLFLDSLAEFAERISLLGALNSLSQLTLKLTMPGIPDIYQGTEFWDLSFVDPDNRRPIDFAARAETIKQISSLRDWHLLVDTWKNGAIKLALLHHLLEIRGRFRYLFDAGDYRPVPINGKSRDHVIAFARCARGDALIVAVGRLFAPLTDSGRRWPRATDWRGEIVWQGYQDIELLGPVRDRQPGAALDLSALFDVIPIAILRAKTTT
jgi:(1->4)-alpha-D-glucan 1-alpha-D-glucosylmutase